MTNLEKIEKLNEIWYSILCNHFKDRDCHFYITQTFSYGKPGEWSVQHHGYIYHSYEETIWNTYEEAQLELIRLLKDCIIQELEFYVEHYGDPDWDQHPKYDKEDLEEHITRVMLLTQ